MKVDEMNITDEYYTWLFRYNPKELYGKKFSFPLFFLATTINYSVRPWKYFSVDAILVNAYDILSNPREKAMISKHGLRKYLGFDGIILVDSGGYMFTKHKDIPVTPTRIVNLYEKWKPDIAVTLDHPITPELPENEVKKRLITTINNTKIMYETGNWKKITFMPVIHGYKESDLKFIISKLEKIGAFDYYGIGSLVPLLRPLNEKNLKLAIRVIMKVRELLPDRNLHAFGIGGVGMMPLAFLAGADSTDSTVWIMSTAMKEILSINTSTFRLKNKEEIEREVKTCGCPICREYRNSRKLMEDRNARAIHNAWAITNLAKRLRSHKDNLPSFIYEHIKDNKMMVKLYNYIINYKKQNLISQYIKSDE